MTDEREDRITKTFLGLGGLGQKMAAIHVCTVRERDDLSERFLSRERHPDGCDRDAAGGRLFGWAA
jgi:hypothetical protein